MSIEVKRTEKLSLWAALAQTLRQAGQRIPALHFRRNSGEWWVALPLEHFAALYQDSYDSAGAVEKAERNALELAQDEERRARGL